MHIIFKLTVNKAVVDIRILDAVYRKASIRLPLSLFHHSYYIWNERVSQFNYKKKKNKSVSIFRLIRQFLKKVLLEYLRLFDYVI